ncbi:Hypothetical predicted protein [Pelobates cultripes]|uniref:Uncharacterized protein n=1 Tax=Pelobates cultripes TaxID=61616 RepID=A0AAD1RN49_PELCU|nr:Hypothetical predicted protein [Pelobates cultripes]
MQLEAIFAEFWQKLGLQLQEPVQKKQKSALPQNCRDMHIEAAVMGIQHRYDRPPGPAFSPLLKTSIADEKPLSSSGSGVYSEVLPTHRPYIQRSLHELKPQWAHGTPHVTGGPVDTWMWLPPMPGLEDRL